jgi:hypothetical protein
VTGVVAEGQTDFSVGQMELSLTGKKLGGAYVLSGRPKPHTNPTPRGSNPELGMMLGKNRGKLRKSNTKGDDKRGPFVLQDLLALHI